MNPVPPGHLMSTHALCLARSFKKWTGQDLLPGNFSGEELAEQLFDVPFIIVSHGTEADPILNYGNRAALELWEMSWDEFTRTPSRLTAEAPNRRERARLLEIVTNQGYIDNYSGVRISKKGRRFEISRATVWNLISEKGEPCGQAATFSEWKFL
jgi:MEKHLA domain